MIAEEHQGKGYGSEAVRRVLRMTREIAAWDEVYLSTDRDSIRGARLYERLGFVKTGDMWGDEEIFRFDLTQTEIG